MFDFLFLLLALLASAGGSTEVGVSFQLPAEPEPLFAVAPGDDLEPGVVPVEQETIVYEDGSFVRADGSTGCITASPCAYAAAGMEMP